MVKTHILWFYIRWVGSEVQCQLNLDTLRTVLCRQIVRMQRYVAHIIPNIQSPCHCSIQMSEPHLHVYHDATWFFLIIRRHKWTGMTMFCIHLVTHLSWPEFQQSTFQPNPEHSRIWGAKIVLHFAQLPSNNELWFPLPAHLERCQFNYLLKLRFSEAYIHLKYWAWWSTWSSTCIYTLDNNDILIIKYEWKYRASKW